MVEKVEKGEEVSGKRKEGRMENPTEKRSREDDKGRRDYQNPETKTGRQMS